MSTQQWITSIPSPEAIVLHALSQNLESTMLADEDVIWLRGEVESEEALLKVNQLLKSVPGAERFRITEDNLLQPLDDRLPVRTCPEGTWQPTKKMLTVQLPQAGLGGMNSTSVPIQIVRESSEYANTSHTPSLLECDFESFRKWATETSEARLEFLSYACRRDGSVIVLGQPLPHISGTYWVQYGQVAIPIGYSWRPAVSLQTLNEIVSPNPGMIHLLCLEGHRELDLSWFVKATRSSVRETALEIGGAE